MENYEFNKHKPSGKYEQEIWEEHQFNRLEEMFNILDGWEFDSLHSNIRY